MPKPFTPRRGTIRHSYTDPRDAEPPVWPGTGGLRTRLLLWELADVPLKSLTPAMLRRWLAGARRG
jgi:hypothetical protein